MIKLDDYQLDAITKLKPGNILVGETGSGKSLTALAWALLYLGVDVTKGSITYNSPTPKQIIIITTAKKRNDLEWEKEASIFGVSTNPNDSVMGITIHVDSWNNIKKYRDFVDCLFIFDEQRLVGYGQWVKSFLKISKRNVWILLTATPGDQWSDYIPVFIANGFFKNKTHFQREHCVFVPYLKFPKIAGYIYESRLNRMRQDILVTMKYKTSAKKIYKNILCSYNKELYFKTVRSRWNPFEDEPIPNASKYCYILRNIVNADSSRIKALADILKIHDKAIVFYNFNYELDILRKFCEEHRFSFSEYNGFRHDPLPTTDRWLYLVQYTAGAEGWNCLTTDTIIFYSLHYSYKTVKQAEGRVDRRNTPFNTLYYYKLYSGSSIDKSIGNAVQTKKKFNEQAFFDSQKKHML